MCGWSFTTYTLTAAHPAGWFLAGAAIASLIGASLALRSLLRRERAEHDESVLSEGAPAPPPTSWRAEIAAAGSLLLLPLTTVMLVSLGRYQVVACLRLGSATGSHPFGGVGGDIGTEWPPSQLDLLGLGAALWIPVLLLAALALGLATAQRLRARRRRWVHDALDATPPDAQLRYRALPHQDRRQALRWLLRHPGPSAPFAAFVAGLLAAAIAALASGATHAAWSFRRGLEQVRLPAQAPSWDAVIDGAFGALPLHALAALVLLAVAVQVALLLGVTPVPEKLRREVARLAPRRSRLRPALSGAMALAALLCLLAAQPLRAQWAHPLPTFVSATRTFSPPEELGGVVLPDLVGPDTLIDAPELVIDRHGRALLDGQRVEDVLDLREMVRRKSIFWDLRHPDDSPLRLLTVAADSRLPSPRLLMMLREVLRAGYSRVQLRFETMHQLEPPPFAGWTHAYRDSAVVVRLAWGRRVSRPNGVTVALDAKSTHGEAAAALSYWASAGKLVDLSVDCEPRCDEVSPASRARPESSRRYLLPPWLDALALLRSRDERR